MSGLDRRTTIAIVTHVLSTGPADALETYAGTRAGRVVFIGHSFADARIYRSFVRRREAGALSGEQVVPWSRRVPGPGLPGTAPTAQRNTSRTRLIASRSLIRWRR